jgi:hypothetical protein
MPDAPARTVSVPDSGKPHQVDGDFSDEELVSLVTFIRATSNRNGSGTVVSLNAFQFCR